ncbi:hypothetical protein JCM3765_003270 [Sporobolomyces pararoseus]
MLGASTKHFKTYGKRKVNVINKRVVLGDSNSNSNNNNNNNNNKVKSGGWSDSSSSDSEEEVAKRKPSTIQKKKPTVVMKNRKNDPSQNKENSSTSTSSAESSSTSKTSSSVKSLQLDGKKKHPEVLVLESSEESSDLTKSFQPRVPLKKKPVVTSRGQGTKSKFTRAIESEGESEEEVEIFEQQERIEEILILEDDTPAAEEEEEASLSESSLESIAPSRPFPALSPHAFPSILSPLLRSTFSPASVKPYDFSSFVTSPLSPFSLPSTEEKPWRKVGEASYSEVFSTFDEKGEEVVIKIIPIASINPTREQLGEEDMPDASDWKSVKREIEISECLGGETSEKKLEGFVKFRGSFLVQGSYPSSLLSSWDLFKAQQKPPCEDQIRPSKFPSTQMYALILLDHAGTDLESWKMRNWREAREIWDQVVESLARAERESEFEHRDLHWGNILIAPAPPPPSPPRSLSQQLNSLHLTPRKNQSVPSQSRPPTVKATIIDFTLSRLLQPPPPTASTRSRTKPKQKVLYDPFADECIFEGEGDLQFDIYRGMRTIVERDGGEWEKFHPLTNLLWLHYLMNKLLYSKKLKTPTLPPPTPAATSISSPGGPGARAVPSPRKSRRHSLLFSSGTGALPSSPVAERKSRTLPSSSLLSRQYKVLSEKQRKEMGEEMKAWEILKSAEEKLKEILGDLLDGNGDEGRAKSSVRKPTAKSRGKGAKKIESKKDGGIGGAAEFAEWCDSLSAKLEV